MTAGGDHSAGLAGFAKAHELEHANGGALPSEGGLLSRGSLTVGERAAGALPGGAEGTLAHVSYEYRSGDTTRTRRLTAVVTRVPESIGFAPYLGDAGSIVHAAGAGISTRNLELADGLSVRVDEGIDESWLRELFSPALVDWLARSPEGFEWELANGVLVVSRPGLLDSERDLVRLCEDAGHVARAIREESLEEFDSGTAAQSAARTKVDQQQVLLERLLDYVPLERPPANVIEARPRFRELVVRHPSTYLIGIFMALVWTLAVNVIGGGIFGLLLNIGNPLLAVAIFEAVVIGTAGFLSIRHEINSRSAKLATAAFWREYARSRELEPVEPRGFAATHAKAELPGAPKRVFAGTFDGVAGALMLTGDGLKRGDSIAIVAGPLGPVASADFQVSAPGASLTALDSYVERLAAELADSRR
jgi:hypothetical protein